MASEDYFKLFGLPSQFALDDEALDATWRRLAAQVHPDRYATAGAAERRVAMQWASTINDAYRVLKSPIERARYLCEQAGYDLQTESNTKMEGQFLMHQMEWREQLDEVRSQAGIAQAEALVEDIQQHGRHIQRKVGELIDQQHDYAQAAAKVREWMFIHKLLSEARSVRNTLHDKQE